MNAIDNLNIQFIACLLATLSVVPAILAFRALARLLRARQIRRDANRFQSNPRPGDRAGYCITGSQWMVGEVIRRRASDNRNTGWVVELETTTYTALGQRTIREWRPVRNLEYFGPEVGLGLHDARPDVRDVRDVR